MRRVVVTGIGLVTSLGTGVEKTWNALIEGKTGIANITGFDATDFPSKVAGEVKDFNPEDYIDKKEIKKLARYTQFAIAATKMAMDDSGLVINDENAERVA